MQIIDVRKTLKTNTKVKWPDFNAPRHISSIKLGVIHHTSDYIVDLNKLNDIEIRETRIYKDGCERVPYHYWINLQGVIYWCNDLEQITWTCNNANPIALSIALCGNFQQNGPRPNQVKALKELLDWLCKKRPDIPNLTQETVYGHGEEYMRSFGNRTSCPGKYLQPLITNYRKFGDFNAKTA